MRVGLIARMDRTGLGQGQTLRLARLLNPDMVMVIDSTPFNGNEQFPNWYRGFNANWIQGFPTDDQVKTFLGFVDVVISCETFYNNNFTTIAKRFGKKTILISNYEFFDWFGDRFFGIPRPDKIIMPSYWHLAEMKQVFGATYLPTPLFDDEFKTVAEHNLKRTGKPRFLFVNGRQAVHDRNGLLTMYDALKYTDADFEIVVKGQGELPICDDPRIVYDLYDAPTNAEIYRDFDLMIMPRRYAGQCLPMTEALASALPVIMTDIDPNNVVLPKEWLIPALHTGTFMTRKPIDLYSGDPKALAKLMETYPDQKERALELSKQFSAETLKPLYEEVINVWK